MFKKYDHLIQDNISSTERGSKDNLYTIWDTSNQIISMPEVSANIINNLVLILHNTSIFYR
jgi:hypothetical protein